MIRAFTLLFLALPCAAAEIFGGAQVAEVYRIRLDRGDLLLETIQQVIRENHIADGAVLTAVGSLGECTFHRIKSTGEKPEDEFLTVKEPIEILNINGVIGTQGAFGGHLEKGCRVLYRAEVTIAKFSGTPLARKANKEGVPLLQRK
jgi:predicted DNA-binding protein with PD1-like motif